MYFMKAIAILIARILSCRMINRLMLIPPGFQRRVDVVFIGKNQAPDSNGLLKNRLNRFLLHIRQHVQDDLAIALNHAQDRRFFPFQRATSGLAFQTAAATWTAQLSDDFGMAFVTRHNIDFITLDLAAQVDRLFLTAIPSRNCVVMICTSSGSKSNSTAIC